MEVWGAEAGRACAPKREQRGRAPAACLGPGPRPALQLTWATLRQPSAPRR